MLVAIDADKNDTAMMKIRSRLQMSTRCPTGGEESADSGLKEIVLLATVKTLVLIRVMVNTVVGAESTNSTSNTMKITMMNMGTKMMKSSTPIRTNMTN